MLTFPAVDIVSDADSVDAQNAFILNLLSGSLIAMILRTNDSDPQQSLL